MPIKVAYDKNIFKCWTSQSAYMLGFFCADGNMVKTKRGTHYVAWYSADKSIIESIKKILRSAHKISVKKSTDGVCYCLQLGSKELFQDLTALGIFPGKTGRMRLPDIPERYLGDFIRGYFDGDGNVWMGEIHRNRLNGTLTLQVSFTSGSHEFLEDLLSALKRVGVLGGSLNRSKKANFSRLTFSVNDSLLIYKIMYTTGHELFLKRKKDVFEKFVSTREKMRA